MGEAYSSSGTGFGSAWLPAWAYGQKSSGSTAAGARQRQIEQSIQRYLDAMETADRTQPAEVEAKTERLTEKIKKLREQMRELDRTKEQLKHEPERARPRVGVILIASQRGTSLDFV